MGIQIGLLQRDKIRILQADDHRALLHIIARKQRSSMNRASHRQRNRSLPLRGNYHDPVERGVIRKGRSRGNPIHLYAIHGWFGRYVFCYLSNSGPGSYVLRIALSFLRIVCHTACGQCHKSRRNPYLFHLILFFWLSTIQLQLKRRYIIGIYGLDISPPDLPGGVQALDKLRDICLALFELYRRALQQSIRFR